MLQGLRDRYARHQLGTRRAGSAGKHFAAERWWTYVGPRLGRLLAATALLLGFSGPLWLLLEPLADIRQFLLGAYVASALWSIGSWTMRASGASLAVMGAEAELWTHQELARLGPSWRVVNHVLLPGTGGDVDHVAVGPNGIIVIESRWKSGRVHPSEVTNTLTKLEDCQARLLVALGQRPTPDRPSLAVLAYWGPDLGPLTSREPLGKFQQVVAGERLRPMLESLVARERLSMAERDSIVSKLTELAARTDEREAERFDNPAERMKALATVWTERLVAAFTGFVLSALALRLGAAGFAAAQLALVLVGLAIRRTSFGRSWASGWICGSQVLTIALVVLAVRQAVG